MSKERVNLGFCYVFVGVYGVVFGGFWFVYVCVCVWFGVCGVCVWEKGRWGRGGVLVVEEFMYECCWWVFVLFGVFVFCLDF